MLVWYAMLALVPAGYYSGVLINSLWLMILDIYLHSRVGETHCLQGPCRSEDTLAAQAGVAQTVVSGGMLTMWLLL